MASGAGGTRSCCRGSVCNDMRKLRPVTIILLPSGSPTASTRIPHQLISPMDRTRVKTGGEMRAMQSSCLTPTILPISTLLL